MIVSPFDNLPPLSKQEALKILSTPISELELSSDYYKAVFHLFKYPGLDTEQALLNLVQLETTSQPLAIARRKAVEVLGRLGCANAIPAIFNCLNSNDPYLVENSAWALQELGCKDSEMHRKIASLLSDPIQSRRVLVQSLASMGAVSEIEKIKSLLNDPSLKPAERGACIVAIARLSGEAIQVNELEKNLFLLNQNDRQCAIQDIIDANAIQLIPAALRSPVAPFFRIRVVDKLWPDKQIKLNDLDLFLVIDSIIRDNPNQLKLVHSYNEKTNNNELINALFGTDFGRCYLALQQLLLQEPSELWGDISSFIDRARTDYGAIYFFILLFSSIPNWDDAAIDHIEDFTLSSLESQWPQYMKFRPIAILTLMRFRPAKYKEKITKWLNEDQTPYWACRYAALMSIEPFLCRKEWDFLGPELNRRKFDSNRFVRAKAKIMTCDS